MGYGNAAAEVKPAETSGADITMTLLNLADIASLEMTAAPEKTTWCPGEQFSTSGMQITAVLKNGYTCVLSNETVLSCFTVTPPEKYTFSLGNADTYSSVTAAVAAYPSLSVSCPITVDKTKAASYSDLIDILASYTGTAAHTVTLAAGSYTAESAVTIKSNITLITESAGCTITRSSSLVSDPLFTVSDNASFNLGSSAGKITIDGGSISVSAPLIKTAGTSCALAVDNCELRNNFNTGNTYIYGGAVYIFDGTCSFRDTVITGCRASEGGAVYCSSECTIYSGTTISGNLATDYGGAFYVNSTLNLYGGVITGNSYTSSSGNGGGIYVPASGTCAIHGSPKVTGNKTDTGAANNLFTMGVLTVDGALSGASIGITLNGTTGTITSGFAANSGLSSASGIFTSDEGKTVNLTDGEAVLE